VPSPQIFGVPDGPYSLGTVSCLAEERGFAGALFPVVGGLHFRGAFKGEKREARSVGIDKIPSPFSSSGRKVR